MAPIVTFQSDSPQALLDQAADIVRRGGVLAIPTDSYYGLGASPFDDTAVGRVCRIKGHADGKPILVLIANLEQLADLIDGMTPAAALLMKRFWPGPLTIVMHASKRLPTLLTAGTGTIGVRQPTTPILARLLRHVGPLTGTSAHRTG